MLLEYANNHIREIKAIFNSSTLNYSHIQINHTFRQLLKILCFFQSVDLADTPPQNLNGQ